VSNPYFKPSLFSLGDSDSCIKNSVRRKCTKQQCAQCGHGFCLDRRSRRLDIRTSRNCMAHFRSQEEDLHGLESVHYISAFQGRQLSQTTMHKARNIDGTIYDVPTSFRCPIAIIPPHVQSRSGNICRLFLWLTLQSPLYLGAAEYCTSEDVSMIGSESR
jgi:hypothetical protein